MRREVTFAQLLCWMLALVGGVAALYWACLLFVGDHEQRAAIFVAGGLSLVLWAANHLTDGQYRHG